MSSDEASHGRKYLGLWARMRKGKKRKREEKKTNQKIRLRGLCVLQLLNPLWQPLRGKDGNEWDVSLSKVKKRKKK